MLGGAASGKSAWAEKLVLQLSGRPVYIATAQSFDGEMTGKIDAHRARRGSEWTTVEEPLDLAGALAVADGSETAILVDCLTLWLSNLMAADRDIDAAVAELAAAIDRTKGRLVLVSNEIGLGIVPDNAMAREFRNRHGAMNEAIAASVDRVVFVAAGLPLALKGSLD